MIHLRELTIFNFLFYLANTLWLLEFIFFRNRKKTGSFQEKKSFWFLTSAIGLMIISTIYFSRMDWGKIVNTSIYPIFQLTALGFYAVGLWLRYQGSSLLGANFTRHVAVSSEMVLVSKGPYRYLRHPLYLGLMLITIAFPLFVGNLLAFLINLPILVIGFSWRMHVEEKALASLHPQYLSWAKKRYRFIPFIY